MILSQPGRSQLPNGSAGFSLRLDEAEYPKNFTAELRGQLRLVYRAAREIGVRITVRKQQRSHLVWKQPVRTAAVRSLTQLTAKR